MWIGKVELDTCKLSKVVLLMRFLGNGLQAKLAVAVERRFPLERTAYTVESRYIFSTNSGNWDLETVGSHEQREVVCKVHMQRYLLCSKYLSRIALFSAINGCRFSCNSHPRAWRLAVRFPSVREDSKERFTELLCNR